MKAPPLPWLTTALASLLLACSGQVHEDRALVATWQGGSIVRTDYDSWRQLHELEDGPETAREMAYVMSMAAATRARGADQALRTQVEIEAMRHAVLVPALRRHLRAAVEVSDYELEELRSQHPEAFKRPRKLLLRNIYKRLGDSQDGAATRRSMARIHQELLAGADFATMARRESESQSRFRDGSLGYLALEELPKEVADALAELRPSQLSDPVEHGGGMTIFRCEDIRAAEAPSPADVLAKLRANLTRQRATEAWHSLRDDLLARADLQMQESGDGGRGDDRQSLATQSPEKP